MQDTKIIKSMPKRLCEFSINDLARIKIIKEDVKKP